MIEIKALSVPVPQRRPLRGKGALTARAGLALALFCAVATPRPLPAEEVDPWQPFRLLEGTWEAAIDGKLGTGKGIRRYDFILEDLYFHARHASVRMPQEKSPKGDYHRELSVYSFDRQRGTIVLRQFVVEGYVLRYTCAVEPRSFVCTSESIESGPGQRARLTIRLTDRYRFEEIFELASPGGELEVFFTNTWVRLPDLAD